MYQFSVLSWVNWRRTSHVIYRIMNFGASLLRVDFDAERYWDNVESLLTIPTTYVHFIHTLFFIPPEYQLNSDISLLLDSPLLFKSIQSWPHRILNWLDPRDRIERTRFSTSSLSTKKRVRTYFWLYGRLGLLEALVRNSLFVIKHALAIFCVIFFLYVHIF